MNQGSSKSLLPLVEILVAIGIFAVAVGLTLQLFLLASFLGHKTADTAKAIFEVQTVAENIKSIKTEENLQKYLKEDLKLDETMTLYYDENWEKTGDRDKAVYKLEIKMETAAYGSGGLYNFVLDFYKIKPYPFIDDKKLEKLEKDEEYHPLLASVNASKFITEMK